MVGAAHAGLGVLLTISLLAPPLPPPVGGVEVAEPPELSATSWILYDLEAEVVLGQRNPDLVGAMASVTKLMTARVALQRAELDEVVTISPDAAATREAGIGIVAGETWVVKDLLSALLIRSANDAAVAVAEHVGGTVDGFVAMMNAEAGELGMRQTSFANPHGLDEEGHHTTARDLLLLARASLADPVVRAMARTRVVQFRPDPSGNKRVAQNTNELIAAYPGVVGLKTGFTSGAGRVLISVLEDGERTLIGVVLGSEDHFADTRELLEFGLATGGVRDHLLAGLVPTAEGAVGDEFDRIAELDELATGESRRSNSSMTPGAQRIRAWLADALPVVLGGS